MYLIRQFETVSGEQYTLGKIRGFLHLYTGQEAVAVGAVSALDKDDYIVSHYRDHGHALARGVDTNRVMAELFGKQTGLSKGKGGSMHIFDANLNFMGGHAIVGAQLPLSLGLALAHKHRGTRNLTACFFGDGATAQGVYHESLNLASLWNLPLVFVLENNLYGMGTATGRARAIGDELSVGVEESYGIKTFSADGMDVLATRAAMRSAVAHVRDYGEPAFVEFFTYRYVGHSLADGQNYRSDKDIEPWRSKDPILTFPEYLTDNKIASASDIKKVKAAVDAEIAASVDFAEKSPLPELDELWDDIYA